MVFPHGLQAVSDASHAVVQKAKDSGVWVFGGSIDEDSPRHGRRRWDHDGGTYPQTTQLGDGHPALELPSYDAALEETACIAISGRLRGSAARSPIRLAI